MRVLTDSELDRIAAGTNMAPRPKWVFKQVNQNNSGNLEIASRNNIALINLGGQNSGQQAAIS